MKKKLQYYQKYFNELPGVDLATTKLTSIEPIDSGYKMIFDVQPFFGPHNSIGEDQVVMITENQIPKVLKFTHIKSYELPENYKSYLKNR